MTDAPEQPPEPIAASAVGEALELLTAWIRSAEAAPVLAKLLEPGALPPEVVRRGIALDLANKVWRGYGGNLLEDGAAAFDRWLESAPGSAGVQALSVAVNQAHRGEALEDVLLRAERLMAWLSEGEAA